MSSARTHADELSSDTHLDERYIVPGLVRGIRLLETFTRDAQEQSVAQMAAKAKITRSTAFRLVYTLEAIGYLRRLANGKTFRLGTNVLNLGYSFLSGQEMVELANPILENLRNDTHFSTHLVLREGTEIVYVARCSGNTHLVSGITVGTRLPAHATISGRVMLSHLPLTDVVGLYEHFEFKRFTDSTIASLGQLVTQLEEDRKQRSLVSHGYFDPGIASIAAPVFNRAGLVEAAVIATCPINIYPEDTLENELRLRVEQAAARISKALGHQP